MGRPWPSALEDACAQQQKQLAQLDDAYRDAASHCAAQTEAARQDAQLQAKLANAQLAALTQQQAALPLQIPACRSSLTVLLMLSIICIPSPQKNLRFTVYLGLSLRSYVSRPGAHISSH